MGVQCSGGAPAALPMCDVIHSPPIALLSLNEPSEIIKTDIGMGIAVDEGKGIIPDRPSRITTPDDRTRITRREADTNARPPEGWGNSTRQGHCHQSLACYQPVALSGKDQRRGGLAMVCFLLSVRTEQEAQDPVMPDRPVQNPPPAGHRQNPQPKRQVSAREPAMSSNPLTRLNDRGQAFWLDGLSRQMLDDGSLQRRIEDQRLSGVVSNPTVFAKAMMERGDAKAVYDPRIRAARETTAADSAVPDPRAIYERLVVDDVRDACDLLLPRHRRSREDGGGVDGCVGLEVAPHLTDDTAAIVREGRRLWAAVGCQNLLIRLPGTPRGLAAVEQLLTDGINVEIMLPFGPDGYEAAARAHVRALERRLRDGQGLNRVCSVASLCLSRIDAAVDTRLTRHPDPDPSPEARAAAEALRGRTAIALARLAYARLRALLASRRWGDLAAQGAVPPRLRWSSTDTPEPGLSGLHYIEPLIGSHTIATMSEATADAFEDHGHVSAGLDGDLVEAEALVQRIEAMLAMPRASIAEAFAGADVLTCIDTYDGLLDSLADRARRLGPAPDAGPLRLFAERLRTQAPGGGGANASPRGVNRWQRNPVTGAYPSPALWR